MSAILARKGREQDIKSGIESIAYQSTCSAGKNTFDMIALNVSNKKQVQLLSFDGTDHGIDNVVGPGTHPVRRLVSKHVSSDLWYR